MNKSHFRNDFTPPKGDTEAERLYVPADRQLARIRAAATLINAVGKSDSILDVGCGFGDIVPYIDDYSNYTGIDTDKYVIEACRTKQYLSGCSFIEAGLEDVPSMTAFDMVICLGVGSYLKKDSLEWFIKTLMASATGHLILELHDQKKYGGFFTSFDKERVFSLCGFTPTKDNLIEHADDTTFTFRVDL